MIEALVRLLGDIFAPLLGDLICATGRLVLRMFGIRSAWNSGLAMGIGGVLWGLAMIAGAMAWLMAVR